MDNKEYWLREGRSKIESLKVWNPEGKFPEDLLLKYFQKCDSEDINLAFGDLSDAVKDRGILMYMKLLKRDKVISINSEEVRSEVIDFLQRHNYGYIVNNNKIELK